MEDVTVKKISKKLVATALVIVLLFSYFTMLTFATEDEENSEDNVVLDVKWKEGQNVDSNGVLTGFTKTSYTLEYNLKFNNVQTGFQDVEMTISNKAGTPIATINSAANSEATSIDNGQYSRIVFGNKNTGKEFGGSTTVTFGAYEEIYEKEIVVTVTGSYRDGGETITFTEQKVLKANVTPVTEITNFLANVEMQRNNKGTYVSESVISNSNSLGMNEYGKSLGWYSTKVTAKYPIHINSYTYTKNLKLDITINRLVDQKSQLKNDANNGKNYEINWGELEGELGQPKEQKNEDGSVTYTFTKEIKDGKLDKDNPFSLDKDFTIIVTYDIPNKKITTDIGVDEAITEWGTTCILKAELEATGFEITKEYNKEEEVKELNKKSSIRKNNEITLALYTPGDNAWIGVHLSTENSSYLAEEDIDNFIDNKTMDLAFSTSINNDYAWGRKASNDTGFIVYSSPIITYLSDSGKIETKELNTEQIRLKSIKGSNEGESSFIYNENNNNIIKQIGDTYNVPDEVKVNEFKIRMDDFLNDTFDGFTTTYTLYADKLELTNTELENILTITLTISTSGSQWCKGGGSASYYNSNSLGNKYSYMEFNIQDDNFNSDISNKNQEESKELTIKMYKNTNVIKTETLSVYNENPVFYVSLPSMFNYSNIRTSITDNPYISINEEQTSLITKDGQKYLVIVCDGIYNSSKIDEVDIIINFTRKLTSNSSTGRHSIYAYMFTDNERYFTESKNDLRLTKGDIIPEKAFLKTISFNIDGSKSITATTSVERNDGSNINYEPNPSNGITEYAEKDQPIIFNSGDSVIYKSELSSVGGTLSNISIISRLPIEKNVLISNTNSQIIEDDYTLPDEFYNKYGKNINGLEKGEPVNQISLTGLTREKIKVYKNDTQEVPEDQYTLYYSIEAAADFTTENFIKYDEDSSKFDKAKSIKIVFNQDCTLTSGSKYTVQFEMKMPENAGMVGAKTGAQYTKNFDKAQSKLYSPVAYVINGKTTGNLKITKKFEGYTAGNAPSGEKISDIKFKLQYIDEIDNTRKFLKINGEDVVATTNENGEAIFSNIPYGEYYLYEETKFNNYLGIGNLILIDLEAAETKELIVENKMKRGNINIKKEWENTNDQQGQVTFKVKRTNNDNIRYEKTVTTDEDGTVTLVGVPYGKYTITEESNIAGWVAKESKEIELNDEENKEETEDKNKVATQEVTITNRLGRATLQIVKTVPEGEKVDELTFRVSGFGTASYVDKEGKEVTNNTDYTIRIGDTESLDDKVQIEKNGTTATITIEDLPLGLYNIEEIDMPTISDKEIEKYVSVYRTMYLNTDGKTENLNISNKYKYGDIEIIKTARLKDGNKYIDIGDLSGFQVVISGKSYYGTEVYKVINLDENGYGTARLEIGEYKVEEVASDGYTTYYGVEGDHSEISPTVTINYNGVARQLIYNEHTGVGYVKVEKSLEGVTEPQKVVDAGIQFQVVGQNVAGGRVKEIISINQIDTVRNVAYGISGPISSNGEYELQEIESTIPEFFEGIEPVAIDLKTEYTQEKPLVIEAENSRTKGNLEIKTQTNPTGGDLYGIKYNVTEVQINSNGTYSKIGKTTEIAGSNDLLNTSFAEMKEIDAGYYLVEQVAVPDGWNKDVSQIVEVPSYNTGYANFEITQNEKLKENKVTINKIILNENNEVATDEEIEKAQLNKNESFEVKITNVNSLEEYYVFTTRNKPGVIQGLDAGIYKIEEVYKPKYITEGYYNNIVIKPNEIDGLTEEIEDAVVEQKIEPVGEEYYFRIGIDGDREEDIKLTIKNKINTEFGFGGQEQKDNLSKTKVEEEQAKVVTKAEVYVVDEKNKAISGVKFRLVNSDGKVITLNGRGSEFEIPNKKLTIRGLDVGKYTLECVEVPEGYLKPENEEIIIFADATQVARVEVQKNIPRGSITLSTVYKTDSGETKYIPRSKYKVVNKETGELLRFVRTATGDYKKSNLESASPLIVLKSGVVEVQGIETGDYEVGIVDVTKGYGIQSQLPEDIKIEENVSTNVSVEVINKAIVQVESGYQTSMYLNESGELFVVGYGTNGIFGKGNSSDYSSQFTKIDLPKGVKISKFSFNYQSVVAIDTEGRAWAWGADTNGVTGLRETTYEPTLIANGAKRFVDVSISSETGLLLDIDGNVWATGYYVGDGTSNKDISLVHPISEFLDNGIKVKKLAKMRGYSSNAGVIDTQGRIWMWGPSSKTLVFRQSEYKPVCVSEFAEIEDVEFEDLVLTEDYAMALDVDGNVWLWGINGPIVSNILQLASATVPTKVNSSNFGNAKIKLIQGTAVPTNTNDIAIVVDEFGKVWTWGMGTNGQLGNGICTTITIPVCISNDEIKPLYGNEIKDIGVDYQNTHIIAVDTNNRIWAWGGVSAYGEAGQSSAAPIMNPQMITNSYNEHLEYNLKFKQVFTEYYNHSFAIDEEGKLWAWGASNQGETGIYTNNSILIPTEVYIPGNPKIKKISSYNNHTLILSEDGRVYTCGKGSPLGNGRIGQQSGIIEITENFNLSNNEKIVDVYVAGEAFIALNQEGKVYTWGVGSNCAIGRSGDVSIINSIENEILKDMKIIKVQYYGSNTVCALADNGNVYRWIGTNNPELISSGENFVDLVGYYLLDDNGKVWTVDYSNKNPNISTVICRSDMTTNPLYKNYRLDSDYRIVKMYDTHSSSYAGSATLKDSNGDLWEYKDLGNNVVKLQGVVSSSDGNINADLMPKDVISLAGWLLVDKYGQIWVYKNISNYNGEAGNGTTTAITQPICLTASDKNTVYNIKMKKILSDNFVADEKGRLYEYKSNGIAKLNGISPVDYIEGTLGINIVEACTNEGKIANSSGIGSISNIEAIAIDENGKLWEGNYTTVTNLSEVKDSELAEKYKEDSSFKIKKIYYNNTSNAGSSPSSTKYAIDSDGKLWAWGVNTSGRCGNGKTTEVTSPTCISGIEGVESLEFVGNSVIAKGGNGKVWVWGVNTNGYLGNGSTAVVTTPYCINTAKLDNKQIKEIVLNTYGLILCTDGSVYVAGDKNMLGKTDWTFVGNCPGAERLIIQGYLYIISGENKVWTLGKNNTTSNSLGQCGTNDAKSEYIKEATLISTEFTVNKSVSQRISTGKSAVIDTNGNVWQWGGTTASNVTGPERLNLTYKVLDYVGVGSGYAMDDKGVLHSTRDNYDISNAIKDIYGELNEENIYKAIETIQNNKTIILSNGKLWKITLKNYAIDSYKCLNNLEGSELAGKEVVDGSLYKAIDSDGNLYVWSQYTGLRKSSSTPVCSTNIRDYLDPVFKANNTIINVPDGNNLYGVKIKQLVNDKFVIDEDNNIWYFTAEGKATNLTTKYQGDKNPLYGKEVKQILGSNYIITKDNQIWYVGGDYPGYVMEAVSTECEYIVTNLDFGYEFYVALDKDGKLWACGKDKNGNGILGTGNYDTKNKPVCLNEMEGSELYEAEQSNPNFKIEKILASSAISVLAVDNSGKLWGWGSGKVIGSGNAETVMIPICISNIEETDLWNAHNRDNSMKIIELENIDYKYLLKDSTGEYWIVDSATNTWKKFRDIKVDGELEIACNDSSFRIKKIKMGDYDNIVLGSDGKVYINSNYYGQYRAVNNLNNITDIYTSYMTYEANTLLKDVKTMVKWIACGDDGVYEILETWIKENGQTTLYSITSTKLTNLKMKKIIQASTRTILALDENGKLWGAGINYDNYLGTSEDSKKNTDFECFSDDASYTLYDIELNDIEIINNTVLATTKDGRLYAWAGMSNSEVPVFYDMYDDIIEELFGVANNDTRKEFTKNVPQNGLFFANDKVYKLETINSELTYAEVSYTEQFINGFAKIQKVVGEDEIQTEDGTIYKVVSTDGITFDLQQTEEKTPFKEEEITEIEIEGVNLIKQTKYKALDDKGNLYVWDTYKGLANNLEGIVCLTNQEYYVEPIYSHSNGWSVIKNQF